MQLKRHISENPNFLVLPTEQFAYRSAHSTEDLLSYAINDWQCHLEKKNLVGVLYLDMSKAFDRIQHQRMIDELFACGIGGTALRWFASYLSDRHQQVVFRKTGAKAAPADCTRGVPQGSVLGPVLFTIYIRHVPQYVHYSRPLLYADDVCLSLPSCPSQLSDMLTHLSADFAALNSYFCSIGLMLNVTKTDFMIVHHKRMTLPSNISVQCGSAAISPSESCKYLGLIIDQHLTFNAHINHLRRDVARKLGAFRRGRSALDQKARKQFYVSIIQSKLEYASNAYVHSLGQAEYDALMAISRRSLRVAFDFPYRADVTPILSCHKLMCLATRLHLRLYLFVYRCVHNLGSPLIANIFHTRTASAHTTAQTRSQHSFGLSLPPFHSRFGLHSLSFLAADRFNSLPASVRLAPSLHARIPQIMPCIPWVPRKKTLGLWGLPK